MLPTPVCHLRIGRTQLRELWDCGFPAAAQVHSRQNPDNKLLLLSGVYSNCGWKAADP